MLKPYYEDEAVALYNCDARELLASLPDEAGVVITDPPYSERTHTKSRSMKRSGTPVPKSSNIDFPPITHDELGRIMSECGRVSPSWVVATMDYRDALLFDLEPPAGLTMKRVGVWVKTNPVPQFTGDRPSQGWEAIAYLHRTGKSKWNGGGHAGNFVSKTVQNAGHPTVKPDGMVRQFVEWFTKPGDTVIDPFAGSGTTLIAARDLGRRAIGCEIDPKYCDLIVERLAQAVIPL